MLDKKLKRKLDRRAVPAFDVLQLEKTIQKAQNTEVDFGKKRMNDLEFVFDQISFIKKEVWILKSIFAVLVLYLLMTERIAADNWLWTLTAISGPMLCLANSREICGMLRPGMVEIQMTARNSLGKTLLIRLTALGLFDLAFFVCMLTGMSVFQRTEIWPLILYGTVPYLVMCFGCLAIINRSAEENLLFYTGSWGIFLCAAAITLKTADVRIYDKNYFTSWILAGILALIGTELELHRFLKKTGGDSVRTAHLLR